MYTPYLKKSTTNIFYRHTLNIYEKWHVLEAYRLDGQIYIQKDKISIHQIKIGNELFKSVLLISGLLNLLHTKRGTVKSPSVMMDFFLSYFVHSVLHILRLCHQMHTSLELGYFPGTMYLPPPLSLFPSLHLVQCIFNHSTVFICNSFFLFKVIYLIHLYLLFEVIFAV